MLFILLWHTFPWLITYLFTLMEKNKTTLNEQDIITHQITSSYIKKQKNHNNNKIIIIEINNWLPCWYSSGQEGCGISSTRSYKSFLVFGKVNSAAAYSNNLFGIDFNDSPINRLHRLLCSQWTYLFVWVRNCTIGTESEERLAAYSDLQYSLTAQSLSELKICSFTWLPQIY